MDGSEKAQYSGHPKRKADVSDERNCDRKEGCSERCKDVCCDNSATKTNQNMDEYPVVIQPGVEDRISDRIGKAYSPYRHIIPYFLITWLSCAVPQCHII